MHAAGQQCEINHTRPGNSGLYLTLRYALPGHPEAAPRFLPVDSMGSNSRGWDMAEVTVKKTAANAKDAEEKSPKTGQPTITNEQADVQQPSAGNDEESANSDAPPKRLMLVVHGLGEQGPGETLDDLAGGLWGNDDNLRVSSDVRLMQDINQSDTRKLETFPCHVRRYCEKNSPDDPHTTFAEVYWADLSRGDEGVIKIFYGLLKTILGLGHILRAGAKQYFGDDKVSQRIANLISYILHGPIAGVNVALALGIFVAFVANKLFAGTSDSGEATRLAHDTVSLTLLISNLLIVGGFTYLTLASRVYYFRIFSGWVAIYGAMLTFLTLIELSSVNIEALKESTILSVMDPVSENAANVVTKFSDGLLWYGVVLVGCLKIAWIAAMSALVLTIFTTLIRFPKTHPDRCQFPRNIGQVPPLVLIIPCTMLWLWMLVVATIWVSVDSRGWFSNQIDPDLLKEGISLLLYSLFGAVLIVAGAAAALFANGIWKWRFGHPAKADLSKSLTERYRQDHMPRLLLSGWIVAGLLLAGALLLAAISSKLLAEMGFLSESYVVGQSLIKFFGMQDDPYISAIQIAVILGGLALLQQKGIAQALGVAKDLITYFKVEPVSKDGSTIGVWNFWKPHEYSEYPQRKRIHGRMQKVLQALWEEDSFDEVIVISHSQGTIIATEFIKELQEPRGELITNEEIRKNLRNALRGAKLVTMGSPFTHVYNYYLPTCFKAPSIILGPHSSTPKDKEQLICSWVNIFRIDDFIGTYIGNDFPKKKGSGTSNDDAQSQNENDKSGDGSIDTELKSAKSQSAVEWPINEAVQTGGHTGYWTDTEVISLLEKHVMPERMREFPNS